MGYRRFGSDGGLDESSGSTVATASPGYAGCRNSNTPRRDADRHGDLRAPGTRLLQKGTRIAPQIFTEARDKDVGTVARLQRDLADMKAESHFLRTPGVPPVAPTPRHVAFTSNKVPRFAGTTSWEQYHQVFDSIVLSNGWDGATAALQLLSHLEGDALNVALLVPVPRRASRVGLVDALSAHYGSPGGLADYRRQFEKTTRTAGEDPSIFAITLETLAMKAFGDLGQTARLRLIRDRFIAGHSSCELHRYLDSVPPETPNRDVVDRCRVWENHADPEIWRVSKPGPEPVYPAYIVSESDKGVDDLRVAAVATPPSTPDQLEILLPQLLASSAAPTPIPAPVPEPPAVERLLQRLVVETKVRQLVPVVVSEPVVLETLLRSLLSGHLASAQQPRPGSFRRDWNAVVFFTCGKAGHSATHCPTLDDPFPFMLLGWKAEKTPGGYMMISPQAMVERRRAENGN